LAKSPLAKYKAKRDFDKTEEPSQTASVRSSNRLLTIRDLRDSLPLSVKEPLAQVDGLRAEFAGPTRRLELQVEQLRSGPPIS
jgi:hypothetical protein